MTRGTLKARIKDAAARGRAVRHRINEAAGLERYALWNEKRSIGDEARVALLAYGFLRGVPYRRIEPHCRPGHELQPARLLVLWTRLLGMAPEPSASIWTEARVAAWLEPMPQAPAREAAVR